MSPFDTFWWRIAPVILLFTIHVAPVSGSSSILKTSNGIQTQQRRPPPPNRRQPPKPPLPKNNNDNNEKIEKDGFILRRNNLAKADQQRPLPPQRGVSSLDVSIPELRNDDIFSGDDDEQAFIDSDDTDIDDEDNTDEGEGHAPVETHTNIPPPPLPPRKKQQPTEKQYTNISDEGSGGKEIRLGEILPPPPPLGSKQSTISEQYENEWRLKEHDVAARGSYVYTNSPLETGPLPSMQRQQQQQQGEMKHTPPTHVQTHQQRQHIKPQQYPPPRQPYSTTSIPRANGVRRPFQQQQQQQQFRPRMQNQQRGRPGIPPFRRTYKPKIPASNFKTDNIVNFGKSMWSRFEKGLDSLADIEDEVTYRAKKQLRKLPGLNSKSTNVKGGTSPSFDSSSTWDNLLNREHPQKQSDPTQKVMQQQSSNDLQNRQWQSDKSNSDSQVDQQQRNWKDLISEDSKQASPSNENDNNNVERIPQPKEKPLQLHASMQQTGTGLQAQSASLVSQNQPGKQQQPAVGKPKEEITSPLSSLRKEMPSFSSTSNVQRKYREEEQKSSFQWLSSLLGRVVPPMPSFRGDSSKDVLDAWDDNVKSGTSTVSSPVSRRKVSPRLGKVAKGLKTQFPPPLVDLIDRYDRGLRRNTLLTPAEKRLCRSIGRNMAIFDVAYVGFLIIGVRQITSWLFLFSKNLKISDITEMTLKSIGGAMLSLGDDTWAYLALAAAYLMLCMKSVFIVPRITPFINAVCRNACACAQYGQLYLRLVSSMKVEPSLPDHFQSTIHSQIVATITSVRLRCFVFLYILKVLILRNLNMIAHTISSCFSMVLHFLKNIEEVKGSLHWSSITSKLSSVNTESFLPAVRDSLSVSKLKEVATLVADDPILLCLQLSTGIALFATAFVMPSFVTNNLRGSMTRASVSAEFQREGNDERQSKSFSLAENLSRLGGCSATRLYLLSQIGSIERDLESWWSISSKEQHSGPSMKKILLATIQVMGVVAGIIFLVWKSLVGHIPVKPIVELLTTTYKTQYMDLIILFCFTTYLGRNSIRHAVDCAAQSSAVVTEFLKILLATVQEMSLSSRNKNMQLSARLSHNKGIKVSDFWVAHKARRGWAVKGANIECRNGEVVLLLGECGSGKTRLLTALSEVIIRPPTRSHTTTRVRGVVSIAGIDASEWDRTQLKQRIGLVLNDVRSVSDIAENLSGLTLNEILEPSRSASLLVKNNSQRNVLRERNAMTLALQITGLSTSLLPRLPSTSTTRLTANEDEFRKQLSYSILSPSEWSKLIVARILAQTIFNSGNVSNQPSSISALTVDGCLMGSLLLLDDATSQMSEDEETQFLQMIKKGAAATILSSNRWSAGRQVDRIYVLGKEGSVVESGTHNELLSRGGLYAAKWHALMKAP